MKTPGVPLLDTINEPAELRACRSRRSRLSRPRCVPTHPFRVGLRRTPRRRSRHGRADGGAALRVRHAPRLAGLGRRSPVLPAQGAHGPADRARRRSVITAGCRASCIARRAISTPSAPATPAPRSAPRSASPWRTRAVNAARSVAIIGDGASRRGSPSRRSNMPVDGRRPAGHAQRQRHVDLAERRRLCDYLPPGPLRGRGRERPSRRPRLADDRPAVRGARVSATRALRRPPPPHLLAAPRACATRRGSAPAARGPRKG